MPEQTPEVLYEGFVARFDQDVEDLHTSGPSGRGRVIMRTKLLDSMKMSGFKLEVKLQISLFELFSRDLVACKEYDLALECTRHILDTLEPCLEVGPNVTQIYKTTTKTSVTYAKIFANYKKEINTSTYSRIAPIAVTRLLISLQDLRVAIKRVFEELPSSKDQEEVAWLILNGCKLILKIAQPLAWLSCGKYVTETLIFASLCMEAVVNLCTCRHLKFRMKLYTTAFYSTMTSSSNDDSQRLLDKFDTELKDLRDREEIDPPVPEKVEVILLAAEQDLAVMRAMLHFWANPDELDSDVVDDEQSFKDKFKCPAVNNDYRDNHIDDFGPTFTERVLAEYIRIHQLTSGNVNETYRRRTAAILRGFNRVSNAFPTREVEIPRVRIAVPGEEGDEEGQGEAANMVTVTDCPFSNMVLLEILGVSLFEVLPEGTDLTECPVTEIQGKIFQYTASGSSDASLNQSASNSIQGGSVHNKLISTAAFEKLFSESNNDKNGQIELALLNQLTVVVDACKEDNHANLIMTALTLVRSVDRVLYSDISERRKSFLQNLSLNLWKHGVYPSLQKALSDTSGDSLIALKAVSTSLVGLLKTLDLTNIQDPLLLGSLSLVVARIIGYFGDYRGSIALLQQAMESVDEHRAARVDVHMHEPIDSRDIWALQRQSFTVKAEAQDWFHSVKRLGAHAFAGFGVFGSSSQTDRTDSALAEISSDLTTLYFRYELEYAVERKQLRIKMKSKLWNKDGKRVRIDLTKKDKKDNEGMASIAEGDDMMMDSSQLGGTTAPMSVQTMLDFNAETLGGVTKVATEQLQIVGQLKQWCERNPYARSLLYVEIARIEKNEDKREHLLQDASKCVEEAEADEENIKAANSDLNIVRKGGHLATPIVIARSHRFIYTVPVGSSILQEKHPDLNYYRIYAKEEKNASAVTMINDEMDGCEKRISVESLTNDNHVCKNVVRIGNLRWGQKYMFASAAYDKNDKHIGSISPSSQDIGALNPLPTVLLWSNIFRAAQELGVSNYKTLAAGHICDRYFLVDPNQGSQSLSVGKGTNLLVGEVPAVCMLAVQQSSPVLLSCFVTAFLSLANDDLAYGAGITSNPDDVYNKGVPLQMRRKDQWRFLSLLRRTCIATIIATYSQQVDLVVRCVTKGYEQAARLLFNDEAHLSVDLQNLLMILLVALQSVSKRHWHELEHKLYCRMMNSVMKLAIINRSTASVVPLLNKLFEDADSSVFVAGNTNEVSFDVQKHYTALEQVLRRENKTYGPSDAPAATESEAKFNAVFAELISPPADAEELPWYNLEQGFLWRRSLGSALHAVNEIGRDAVLDGNADAVKLTGMPESMSDLLSVFVTLVKRSTSDEEADRSTFAKALDYLPIYDQLLSPEVLAVHKEWKLTLVKPMPALPEEPEEPEADEPAAEEGDDPSALESGVLKKQKVDPMEKYQKVSNTEKEAQFRALAEISFLRAQKYAAGTDLVVRNYHPDVNNGPGRDVDTTDSAVFVDVTTVPAPSTDEEEAEPVETAFDKVEYVRHLGAAVQFFSKGRAPSAAIHVGVRLWNFIVNTWQSPQDFAIAFAAESENLKHLFSSLIDALQLIIQSCSATGAAPAYDLHFTLDALGDSDNKNATAVAKKEEHSTVADETITPHIVQEHLSSIQDTLIFLMKVTWLHKQLFDAMELGSRVVDCYLAVNNATLCKRVGESLTPIVVRAQGLIVSGVEAEVAKHQKRAVDCEEHFVEAMKKKRRKKTRTMRVEKDEDDIRHEAEMDLISDDLHEAQTRLEYNLGRLALVKQLQKRFDTLYPTGIQLLNKVRLARESLLQECYSTFGSTGGEDDTVQFSEVVQEHQHLTQYLDEVLDQYDQVTAFLREKKDKVALIDALNEQGDLLLLFGMNVQARSIWHDGLDGLFNAMDCYKDWKTTASDAVSSMDAHPNVSQLGGMINAMSILGKLSLYCAATDWDTKTDYCRFAAELCRAPFLESYGHPVTRVGFAAYVCKDLGGAASFILTSDNATISALCTSLEEIVTTLHFNQLYIQALPVVVLLEHFHALYTHRADLWLKARLLRIRILIDAHLFAQAASMLATIENSVTCISSHTYGDMLSGSGPVLTEGHDTATNGLDFHGLSPFFNHLKPDDDKNKSALEWISGFHTKINSFLATFTSTLQVPLPADEENPDAPTVEEKVVPLFPNHITSEVSTICGRYLLEISLLDGRIASDHSAFLGEQGDKGLEIIGSVASDEIGGDQVDDTSFPFCRWVQQYSDCVMMRSKLLIHRRKYMEARRGLIRLMEYLRTDSVSTYVTTNAKTAMTYIWLQSRNMLADVASKQYRMEDAIKLSTLAVQEAAATCNGFWIRSLLLIRSVAHHRSGHLVQCLTDCDIVLGMYEKSKMKDVSQLRCIALKSNVLSDLLIANVAFEQENGSFAVLDDATVLNKTVQMMRTSYSIAEELTFTMGFLGADANVTFEKNDSNVSKHHYLPPLLHSLTSIHPNAPKVTVKFDKKINASAKNDGKPNYYSLNQNLRAGPIDSDESEVSQSEYTNIYLNEVRVLANCHAALATALDEKREVESFEASQAQAELQASVDESKTDSNGSSILAEQTNIGENALKLLRHIVFASPHSRAALLQTVGRSRAVNASSDHVFLENENDKATPFTTSMGVARSSAHDWNVMCLSCIRLVEYFYAKASGGMFGQVSDTKGGSKALMLKATQYLLCGIQLGNQFRTIDKDAIRTLSDKAFTSIVPPVELAGVMDSSMLCSSATDGTKRSNRGGGVPPPVDPKAKGKPPAAQPVAASTATARDALFMMSSVMRDFEGAWLEADDRATYSDLDALLKKNYPTYSSKCSLPSVPALDSAGKDVSAPANSMSTLWTPVKTTAEFPTELLQANFGRFSHVAGYFVLGGDTPSLKRIVAQRADVVHIRKGILKLRNNLTFAIANPGAEEDLLGSCGKMFVKILELLNICFRDGYIDEENNNVGNLKPKCVINGEGSNQIIDITVIVNQNTDGGEPVPTAGSTVSLAMNDTVIGALADLMCCDKDVDALVEPQVSALIAALFA